MAKRPYQGIEMKVKELRAKSNVELEEALQSLRKDLVSLRMKKSTGQLRTTHELRDTKKNIARVLTLMSENKHTVNE
ncbi:MAG: 50S ribosomal protein L29 [Gammaproteobacteria bacterium]